jgi:hypothetical protein
MRRSVLMVVGLLVAVVAVAVIAGSMLPVTHTITREGTYRATPAQLFALIRNVTDYPAWQRSVTKVELLPDTNGKPRARETNNGQAITYELEDIVPDRGMVSRIADKDLPFGGSWRYEIVPGASSDVTTLRITEKGEVYNPMFRFVSKYVMGLSATIDKFLEAVSTRYPKVSAAS